MTEESVVTKFNSVFEDSDQFRALCSHISKDISAKTASILQLVEQLGVYLVDTAAEKRKYGTLILSTVIENLPETFLSESELGVICKFYSDRLKDNHHVIPAVLKGLLALVSKSNIPSGALVDILNSFQQNVSCQAQQVADRATIFKFLENLATKHKTEMTGYQPNFTYVVITCVDGERDPRNLLFLFTWMPAFFCNYELGHLAEEMFDVLSCYFPVDFRVPANEANGVTREELANNLSLCLTGKSQFADSCLSLSLEKLDSDLTDAKLDAMQLIIDGSKTFPRSEYEARAIEIWKLLNNILLSTNEPPVVVKKAEMTLKVLVDKTENSIGLLSSIKLCVVQLMRIDEPKLEKAVNIVKCAMTNSDSASFLGNDAINFLLQFLTEAQEVNKKILLANLLSDVLCIYRNYFDDVDSRMSLFGGILLQMIENGANDVQEAGLRNLSKFAMQIGKTVEDSFLNIVQTKMKGPELLNKDFINCIIAFQNVDMLKKSDERVYYYALMDLTKNDKFCEQNMQVIFKHLTDNTDLTCEVLKYGVEQYSEHLKPILSKHMSMFTRYILDNMHNIDETVLKNASYVIKNIIGWMSLEAQQDILDNYLEDIELNYERDFKAIYLVDAIICRLHKNALKNFELITELTKVAYVGDQRIVGVIANVVNKINDIQFLEVILHQLESKWEQEYQQSAIVGEESTPHQTASHVILVTTWITKALAMRGHSKTEDWVERLFRLLRLFPETAESFRIVMSEDRLYLSRENYCRESLFYRQKFFTHCLKEVEHENMLLVIGYIIEPVPDAVLKMHFKTVVRLILVALDKCSDDQSVLSILNKLLSMICNQSELIEEYFEEILCRLLVLARFKNNMKIRIVALQCLKHITFVKKYKLIPHKNEVLTILGESLDDSKRQVRSTAVAARLSWYSLDMLV